MPATPEEIRRILKDHENSSCTYPSCLTNKSFREYDDLGEHVVTEQRCTKHCPMAKHYGCYTVYTDFNCKL